MEISNHNITIVDITLTKEEIKEISKVSKSLISTFKDDIKVLKSIRKTLKNTPCIREQLQFNLTELSSFECILMQDMPELLAQLNKYREEVIYKKSEQ